MNPDTGEMAVIQERLAESLKDAHPDEKALREKLALFGETPREFSSTEEAKTAGFEPLSSDDADKLALMNSEQRREWAAQHMNRQARAHAEAGESDADRARRQERNRRKALHRKRRGQ